MKEPSNGSSGKCRKLASCRRHGGVDTKRVHKLCANAKLRHSGGDVVAIGSQNSTETTS